MNYTHIRLRRADSLHCGTTLAAHSPDHATLCDRGLSTGKIWSWASPSCQAKSYHARYGDVNGKGYTPLVVNARTDVFLLRIGDPSSYLEQAVQRAHAYRQAGADCIFPIGVSDANTIVSLVKAISGPINILAGPPTPSIPELAQLGVARVSFGSWPMRATFARLRRIAHELLEHGTYASMAEERLSAEELRSLFEGKAN